MGSFILLPLIFLKFWFAEAPLALISYFSSLNSAFLELFSLPLFIKTFFKPLKNEYRQGLVGFSIGMGIVIKTFFILFDLSLFILLLALEGAIIVGFVTFPLASILLWTIM